MKRLALVLLILAPGLTFAAVQPTLSGPTPLTLTQVAQSTPTYVGQMVLCTNCASANGGLGIPCHSTETATAQNAYIISASSLTATTTCK